MQYRRRWIYSLCYILISISAILLTGCRKNGGTLTVGVRSDISEWSFCDPEKEIYLGLEEEIAELIQEKAGFQNIQYVAVSDPGDAEKKLAAGEIDCIIYDITKNDTSSQDFFYSESYYDTKTYTAAKTSTLFTSAADLSGKKVGILPYETEAFAQLCRKIEGLGLAAPIPFVAGSIYELSEALESGKVSAVCTTDTVIYSVIDGNTKIIDLEIGTQPVSVAVRKEDPKAETIVDTVNRLIEEGSIRELIVNMGWEE